MASLETAVCRIVVGSPIGGFRTAERFFSWQIARLPPRTCGKNAEQEPSIPDTPLQYAIKPNRQFRGSPLRADPTHRRNEIEVTFGQNRQINAIDAVGIGVGMRGSSQAFRARLMCAASLPLAVAGCSQGVMNPQGPIASAERTLLFNSLAIMLTIAVPVILATLGVAWWYRASNRRARYRPTWAYSGRIEIVIWAIPAMIILLLGGIAWIGSHDLDPARPISSARPTLRVQVVALDWKWLFIYPDQGIASVNRLVVPAGRPVSLKLTSGTVMNSFFVPQLAGQIYTMAGMTTELNMLADHPGRFPGLSAQFSGDGFSHMRFAVDALPDDRFVAWTAGARAGGPVLDAAGYDALARPSSAVIPFTYRAIDPALFQRIANLKQASATTPSVPPQSADAGTPDNLRKGS